MPELTREKKLKLVEKLPQQLQDFLYSEDTGAFLLYLGQKYNLPDEKVSLLSKLVGDVVLGIVPITSLAQEINSKITSDAQAAMNLAQELYTELLAPVMTAPSIPPMPAKPAIPPAAPITPAPTPARPADKYREPASSVPEVIDLRKAPPPALSLPPKPITVPPTPTPIPKPAIPAPPLTFTRPVEPPVVSKTESPKPTVPTVPVPQPPLIAAPSGGEPRPESGREAQPHKIPTPASKPITPTQKPQYIMRPSGLPPTDSPHDVLDLRRDKGEF